MASTPRTATELVCHPSATPVGKHSRVKHLCRYIGSFAATCIIRIPMASAQLPLKKVLNVTEPRVNLQGQWVRGLLSSYEDDLASAGSHGRGSAPWLSWSCWNPAPTVPTCTPPGPQRSISSLSCFETSPPELSSEHHVSLQIGQNFPQDCSSTRIFNAVGSPIW